jgi:tricarballylate dehydrogenase
VDDSVEFKLNERDGKATIGLAPPKSNWAMRLEKPPFYGFTVTTGLTFTFGGVRVDKNARVISTTDKPITGLFAAGEMLGGIFYYFSPSGGGLMAGSVFGRIAGQRAASVDSL